MYISWVQRGRVPAPRLAPSFLAEPLFGLFALLLTLRGEDLSLLGRQVLTGDPAVEAVPTDACRAVGGGERHLWKM